MRANIAHINDLLPQFSTLETTFKTVQSYPLEATILIPNLLPSGPRPLLIRYHGGGWMTGSRHTWAWQARWALQFALQHGAIVVIPDYRLLPEATGQELMSDVADMLNWLPGNLERLLSEKGVTADLGRILLTGESAGGGSAVQAALFTGTGLAGFLGPESPVKVKAVISGFGVLDSDHPQFSQKFSKYLKGNPEFPADLVDKHLAAVKAGHAPPVVTGANLPDRFDITMCAIQQGKLSSFVGTEPEVNPAKVLGLVRDRKDVPALWIYHGLDDTVVPVEISQAFVKQAKATFGNQLAIKETLIPGEHAVGDDVGRDEGWVREGLDWLQSYWP